MSAIASECHQCSPLSGRKTRPGLRVWARIHHMHMVTKTWKRPPLGEYRNQREENLDKEVPRARRDPVAGTVDDKRANSCWVWTAVEVGKSKEDKKSHKTGDKRVAISLLPRKADAPKRH